MTALTTPNSTEKVKASAVRVESDNPARCTTALPIPKSPTSRVEPMTTLASAIKPKSAGVSRRASSTPTASRDTAPNPDPAKRHRTGARSAVNKASRRHSHRPPDERDIDDEPAQLRASAKGVVVDRGDITKTNDLPESDRCVITAISEMDRKVVRLAGLEPATSWFVARRSIQLS